MVMSWYYLNESGEVVGPVSEQALKELNVAGSLTEASLVCREGTEDWTSLAEDFEARSQNPQPISAEESDLGMGVDSTCGQTLSAEIPLSLDQKLNAHPVSPKEIRSSAPSDAALISLEKKKIYFALGAGAFLALIVVLTNQPKETGWWIFKTVTTPYQFLVGSAFLLAVGYLFLMVSWYKGQELCARTSILAFLLSGSVSIFISLLVYPLVSAIGAQERLVETGAWIFKTTRRVVEYDNGLLSLLHSTGAIAGFVEEPAKLAALLVVSPVRKLIVDRKSGLYYATLCAFGFALIENIMYFQAYDGVLYIRANPAHAVFTSLWGAALGSWREGTLQGRGFAKFLFLGIGLHALWNFLASTDFTLFIIAFVATIWLGLSFIRRELGGKESAALTKLRI